MTSDGGRDTGIKRETLTEWDDDCRAVLVMVLPQHARTSDQMAACFAAAARLIRRRELTVRGVHLSEVPEGLVLFCDRRV